MEKIKAKIHAFGSVYDGVLVGVKRKKVDIQWTSGTGKVRITRATPVATVEELHGPSGVGKCWLEKPLVKDRGPKLERDPNAIPARKAPPPVEYPEGSVRAARQALLAKEREVRAKLAECEHCKAIRAEANRLMNEAEDLFARCMEEKDAEQGRTTVRRIIHRKKEDEA